MLASTAADFRFRIRITIQVFIINAIIRNLSWFFITFFHLLSDPLSRCRYQPAERALLIHAEDSLALTNI